MPTISTEEYNQTPWQIVENQPDWDEHKGTTTFGKLVMDSEGSEIVFAFEADWTENPPDVLEHSPHMSRFEPQSVTILSPDTSIFFQDRTDEEPYEGWQEIVNDPIELEELFAAAVYDQNDWQDLYEEAV